MNQNRKVVGGKSGVSAWEEDLVIPTYLAGPDDPNPPLQRVVGDWSIYPYTLLDDLTGIRADKSYNASIIENRFLRVIVLPELGGHLYSAYDKTIGREVFYRNNVVKPGLVSLRGAWVSGGVEFNFPKGHTVTTVSPIDHTIQDNPDGSVTVWIGDLEKVSRMSWSVAITLYPDSSLIETKVRLYNRTAVSNRYYFWANAAVPATQRMRFVYPMKQANRGSLNFPIHDGVDQSWYVNHPHAIDLFATDAKDDFFGCYDHDADAGVVHVANWHEDYGKKFFTWGSADDGLIWAGILSDNDGPYCEIQSGRFEDQGVHKMIEPHAVESWTEYWWPLKKMDGFVWANKEAALNLELKPETIKIGANASANLSDASLILKSDGKVIHSENIEISPDQSFLKEIPVSTTGMESVILSLVDRSGREIISYTKKTKPEIIEKSSELQKPSVPEDEMSPEELCLEGLRKEEFREEMAAMELYKKALKKDSGFTPAHTALGILYYKSGQFDAAEKELLSALARDKETPAANYYLGLVLKAKGDLENAREKLWALSRNHGYASLGFYFLGEIAMIEQDFTEAECFFSRSLALNADDTKAIVMLAISLRKQDKKEEALKLSLETLERIPLDHFATMELSFLNPGQTEQARLRVSEITRGEVQAYLELATDYGNVCLFEEAIAVLKEVMKMESDPKKVYPLVYYYIGYYLEKVGKTEEASKYYRLGGQANRDYVFPHRLESIDVLKTVLKHKPEDARAHYYLGNLLFSKWGFEEAFDEWKRSDELDGSFSVVHRNIGYVYRYIKNDISSAVTEYEKAVECAPEDYRLYIDLDHIYEELKQDEKRLKLLQRAPLSVRERGEVVCRLGGLDVELERYDEVIELLEKQKYNPWEGSWIMRHIYVQAHMGRGEDRFAKGNYSGAFEDFEAATKYPRNLGVGKPSMPTDVQAMYMAGLTAEKLGKTSEAKSFWEMAATEKHPSWSELRYYEALALRKLGKEQEALKLFDGLIDFAKDQLEQNKGDATENHYIMGLGYKGKNDIVSAKQAFEEVLKLNPGHKKAKKER